MRRRGMVKTLTVFGPRKQIAKKMTQPWGKQKWCLQSASEIAWVRIERGHSLNRGHSPSKLYSNLIQSPPFCGTLRPVYGLSVQHRKKNTHFSVELRLWNCLHLFDFVFGLLWCTFLFFYLFLESGWEGAEAVQHWGGGGRIRGEVKATV